MFSSGDTETLPKWDQITLLKITHGDKKMNTDTVYPGVDLRPSSFGTVSPLLCHRQQMGVDRQVPTTPSRWYGSDRVQGRWRGEMVGTVH